MSSTGQETLFRVYVGNLKPNVDDGTLRNVFEEHGIVVGNVLVKRSFAFLDCPDQINVDKAIDRLNGVYFTHIITLSFCKSAFLLLSW